MPHSISRISTLAVAALTICASAIARPALPQGRVRVGSSHLGARRVAADSKLAQSPPKLPVAPHEGALIEWWYVNAHVTTEQKRHLAIVGAFFRLGNGHALLNPAAPQQRSHYLIYAVTDLDARKQRSYSFADTNMIDTLKQIAPFMAALNPSDAQMRKLVASLNEGRLPDPHQQLALPARIDAEPFKLAYGDDNSLADSGVDGATFDLALNGGTDKVNLRLTGTKPPMAVGGKGETGLTKPTDMYYYSLTRCAVTGTVDTGAGPEQVAKGEGWFDHQWGSSWVAQNDGWDWWGAQLSDGSDVLFFRQRSLSTGNTFFPMATFMDRAGHLTVTRNIQFQPDPKSLWKSPVTGARYPLSWIVTFPDQHLRLQIAATVKSQEMPILGPGSAIWEGCCSVYGLKNTRWRDMSADEQSQMALTLSKDPAKRKTLRDKAYKQNMLVTRGVNGIAYMELVGYNSPAVRANPLGTKASPATVKAKSHTKAKPAH